MSATNKCPCCGRAMPRQRTATKPKLMTGEQFFEARMVACRAIAADLGENWHLVEGASYWATIPARLRSFKTARGTKIRCNREVRLPAGRYWPAGCLPDGLVVAPPYARDKTPPEVVRRMAATRELGRLEREYSHDRSRALHVNVRWHDSNLSRYYTPEDRAADIQRAWDVRRELSQARRDRALVADDTLPMAA